jgi:hypothetical protein
MRQVKPFRPCGMVDIAIGYSPEWQTTKAVPFEGVGEYVVTPDTEGPRDTYRVIHCATGYGVPAGHLTLQRARLLAAMMEVRFPRFTDRNTCMTEPYRKLWATVRQEFAESA